MSMTTDILCGFVKCEKRIYYDDMVIVKQDAHPNRPQEQRVSIDRNHNDAKKSVIYRIYRAYNRIVAKYTNYTPP